MDKFVKKNGLKPYITKKLTTQPKLSQTKGFG